MNRTHLLLHAVALLAGSAFSLSAAGRCLNDNLPESKAGPATVAPPDAAASRRHLREMVQEAIKRSQAVGAATLLAEAAVSDVQEARSGRQPHAALSGTLGYDYQRPTGFDATKGAQALASLNIGASLYDAGRVTQLTSWRTHLAEAALLGQMSAQEQVALQTVSLALDRNRYRLQVQVYQQYVRKMSCLVQALEQIVSADRGRTSELVQARKNQQQAELAQAAAQASLRQAEVRLRRFVGDRLPPGEGASALLLDVPRLPELLAAAARSNDILQLEAQAEAGDSLTRAIEAGDKPQLGWQVSTSRIKGPGSSTVLNAGLTYTIPLYSPGQTPAADAARKRAQAARLQVAEALESRRSRTADVHDQALASFERARKVCDVLRNSELVRNYTLQQWQQLGRRSLFDLMSAEGDHYALRVSYVNAITDGQLANALLQSLGNGIAHALE